MVRWEDPDVSWRRREWLLAAGSGDEAGRDVSVTGVTVRYSLSVAPPLGTI